MGQSWVEMGLSASQVSRVGMRGMQMWPEIGRYIWKYYTKYQVIYFKALRDFLAWKSRFSKLLTILSQLPYPMVEQSLGYLTPHPP